MIINLKIVRVNSEYCDYLRKYDNKVAYNKNEKELRPFIGILFKKFNLVHFIHKFDYNSKRDKTYYSNFPNTDWPFFNRGGNYSNGTNAGVFYFNNNNGNSNGSISFRPVLVALRYNEKFKRRIFLLIKYVYGYIVGSIKEVLFLWYKINKNIK